MKYKKTSALFSHNSSFTKCAAETCDGLINGWLLVGLYSNEVQIKNALSSGFAQVLHHIRALQLVAHLPVVVSRSNT